MLNCWSLHLITQNLNSGLISQSGLYVTHKLLVIYLKISLEDAFPSCLWSQHLWGAVEASTLPFISSWLQERGKVRWDLSLAHHHVSLLAQARFRLRLSPYTGYCYSLPLWPVCLDRSWLACQETLLSYLSLHIYATEATFTSLIKNLHKHQEI